MVAMQCCTYVIQVYGYYIAFKVGNRVKTNLINWIYQKSFVMSVASKLKYPVGHIMVFLGNDATVIETYHANFLEAWSAIVIVVFSTVFLIRLIGVSAVVPLIIFVLCIVFGFVMLGIVYAVKLKQLKATDKRTHQMKETFENILFVKFFNLESSFFSKLLKARGIEWNWMRVYYFLIAMLKNISYGIPPCMACVGLITYYAINKQVDIIVVATSLVYFTMYRSAFLSILLGSQITAQALGSFQRIQEFLSAEEVNEEESLSDDQEKKFDVEEDVAIHVENGSFWWEAEEKEETSSEGGGDVQLKDNPKFSLKDVNVTIKRGELVMLFGKSNSGKSSFLKAMLSEMEQDKDTKVFVNGKSVYVGQQPWIFSDTIKKNIILEDEKYDEELLKKVLSICSLNEDIEKMKGSIMQEIGEDGSTISGGQLARIALARAIFSRREILLLDNILGPLDYFNSNHIFNYAILKYLNDKTRLFVTSKTDLLPYADQILHFDNGYVKSFASYEEFVEATSVMKFEKSDTSRYDLNDLYKSNLSFENKVSEEKVKIVSSEERNKGHVSFSTLFSYASKSLPDCCIGTNDYHYLSRKKVLTALCYLVFIFCVYGIGIFVYFVSEFHVGNFGYLDLYHQREGKGYNTSFYAYNVSSNNSNHSVPIDGTYFNISNVTGCPFLNASCFTEMVDITWLFDYRNGSIVVAGITPTISLLIYGLLCLAILILAFNSAATCYFVCLNASKHMVKGALRGLFYTKMKFFYTYLVGRILNRLTRDVFISDLYMTGNMEFFSTTMCVTMGSLLLVIAVTAGEWTGVVVVLLVFVVVVNVAVYLFFRRSGIEMMRVESTSRSHVFHHFNSTFKGMTTIKALDLHGKFKELGKYFVNLNNRSYFMVECLKRTIELYSTLTASFTAALIDVFCIIFSYYIVKSAIGPMNVAISNLVLVIDIVGVSFAQLINLEINMNSIERLDHYARNLEMEKNKPDDKVLSVTEGKVEFKNFSMRYQDYLPLVLENVNFQIDGNEKVAIIGKSGCGKSSLFLSVQRIVDADSGLISIDDQDISQSTLESFRSSVSICPQRPILFNGTIRYNLDFLSEKTDEEIWDMIKICKLEDVVKRENGLEGIVEVNGNNFSVGERRLLSLCRSLLRKNKILLVDENTSIDYKLNETIQQIITKLEGVTVLSITHRMTNIRYYDRVIVMDKGKVIDFDTPLALIKKEGSFLNQFVREYDQKVILEHFNENDVGKVVPTVSTIPEVEVVECLKLKVLLGEEKTECVVELSELELTIGEEKISIENIVELRVIEENLGIIVELQEKTISFVAQNLDDFSDLSKTVVSKLSVLQNTDDEK